MSGSVNIPIGANAAPAVAAFDQLREAMRRAGQEGRSFQQLDLSHPELAGFASDLARVQQQLDDLTRLGRGGTASAMRRVTGPNGYDWSADQAQQDATWERYYPDPAERARMRSRADSYITRGTQFAPPPPPAAPPPGTPAGAPAGAPGAPAPAPAGPAPLTSGGSRAPLSPEEEGPGLMPVLQGLLKGPVGFMLKMSGLAGVATMAGNAVSSAMQESGNNDQLMRRMPDMTTDFDKLREATRRASEGLGLTYDQSQRLALSWVKLSGPGASFGDAGSADNTRMIETAVRTAAGLARSSGSDANTIMGGLARGEAAHLDPQTFARMISDAAAAGGMTGNTEAVMESILHFTEGANRVMPMLGPDAMEGMASRYAGMFAGMTGAGVNAGNASAIIGTLDQSVRGGGGGGMAGTAVNYRAFARHGITDPYRMLYLQEGGAFQDIGGGTTVWEAQKEEIDRQYRNRPPLARLHALSVKTGLPMRQVEVLDRLEPVDMQRTKRFLQGAGIDMARLNPTAFTDISKVLGPNTDLEGERRKMLDRRDLSDAERDTLRGASGEDLRTQIVRSLASHGMERTEHTRMQDAATEFSNGLTALGTHLLEPLIASRDILAKIATNTERALDIFIRFFTTQPGRGPGLGMPGEDGQPAPEAVPGGVGGQPFVTTIGFRVGAGMARGGYGGGRGGFGGGGGGGTPALPQGEVQARAQQAFDFFRGQGWTEEQSAGLVANFVVESGMRTNVTGDRNGMSAGIGQWNRERRARFREQYGHDVTEGTLAEQLEFVQWELTHSHRAAGNRLRGERTAGGAGGAVSDDYEVPLDRDGNRAARGGLAERMLPGLRRGAGQGGGGEGGMPAGARVIHAIAPLRVVHEDRHGRPFREQTLPIQSVLDPSPYGYDANPNVEQRRSPVDWYPNQPRPTSRPPARARNLDT